MAKETRDNRGKTVLIGALVAGGALLAARALAKEEPPKEEPPGEEPACSVALQIIDLTTGQPVPVNSPALVLEGSSYLVRVTITNTSTRLGVPVAANLTLILVGEIALTSLPFPAPTTYAFAAGQTRTFDLTFGVPAGTGGKVGSITATVVAPNGQAICMDDELLTVEAVAVVYSCTLTLSVS